MSCTKNVPIPTFVINRKDRVDRKNHILKEFAGREEFDIRIVEAIENESGHLGLWKSIHLILTTMISPEWKYIIICEDDHKFTNNYDYDKLKTCIQDAEYFLFDVISGGASSLHSISSVTTDLYWTEWFTGLQFTVLFRNIFSKIIETSFYKFDAADLKISSLSEKTSIIYPFISVQQNFGYSDVTENNNVINVEELFNSCSSAVDYLLRGESHYKMVFSKIGSIDVTDYESITIPAYVVKDIQDHRLTDGISEVPAFTIKRRPKVGTFDQTRRNENFRAIVLDAMRSDEDVFFYSETLALEDDAIDKHVLFENVTIAHYLGADILIGSPRYYEHMVPITNKLFWVDKITDFEFVIVYRSFFEKLLTGVMDSQTLAAWLSGFSTNKFGLYLPLSSNVELGVMASSVLSPDEEHRKRIKKALSDFEMLSSLKAVRLANRRMD